MHFEFGQSKARIDYYEWSEMCAEKFAAPIDAIEHYQQQ